MCGCGRREKLSRYRILNAVVSGACSTSQAQRGSPSSSLQRETQAAARVACRAGNLGFSLTSASCDLAISTSVFAAGCTMSRSCSGSDGTRVTGGHARGASQLQKDEKEGACLHDGGAVVRDGGAAGVIDELVHAERTLKQAVARTASEISQKLTTAAGCHAQLELTGSKIQSLCRTSVVRTMSVTATHAFMLLISWPRP